MGRAPCCDKANVKKGPWSPEEDIKLKEFIEKYGTGGNWIALPHKAGLRRCGKSCRLRWLNYLRPNIKHGEFSDDEDRIIFSLFASIGSRWSIIAAQLPGRTDNDIKNYWNTKLKKKLLGIAPPQRKPHQHHQQHQQQQLLLPSPPTSTQVSLEAFPRTLQDIFTAAPTTTTLLQGPAHQYSGSSLLMFGGEQSCSSSDGSCTQISYGQEMEYGCVGGEHMMGFESYLYGGGKRGDGLWGGAPLEYGYEEIRQLLSSGSGLCVEEPTAAGIGGRGSSKAEGGVMFQFSALTVKS